MLPKDGPQNKRFYNLLDEIKQEVHSLKTEILQLKKENDDLKSQLAAAQKKQDDVFSSLEETERIAFKHQIKGLIAKIDEHLENRA